MNHPTNHSNESSRVPEGAKRKLALAMYGVDHAEERLDPEEGLADYLPAAEHLLRAILPYIHAEIRERLLAAMESARQANVGMGWCNGDLFKGRSENEMAEGGVQVVALDDFNAALDQALGEQHGD